MSADLPSDVDFDVVCIIIEHGDIFGVELSDVVAAAVTIAAAEVVGALRGQHPSSPQRGSPSMHEAGVTERILEIVLEHANEAHAQRVTDVYLDVGEESGIDTDALELHWPLLSQGSLAEGATLHFNSAPDEPFSFRLTSIEVDEPVN